MGKKINIYIACHKPTYVFENPLFIPVQVGTALAEQKLPGMKYDNTGDNISDKNREYSEVTAQYWAWKNEQCDYYGFMHYRRYFSFEHIYPVGADGTVFSKKKGSLYIELDNIWEDLSRYRLEEAWIETLLVPFDIVTILSEKINTTVYCQFCQYHPKESLDLLLTVLKKCYPKYAAAADIYMNSKNIYYMNMYIMKKEIFQEYMTWLFDILNEFEKQTAEYENWRKEPRLMGYLAERLFGVFYTFQKEKNLKCAELAYLRFYNTEEDKEVSLSGSIRTFHLGKTKHVINIDMRKLNQLFPAGSRRRILLRHIFIR